MRKALLISLLGLVATSAHGVEPYTCRNGYFPGAAGSVRAAVVRGGPQGRSSFRSDAKGCPEGAACIDEATVVRGDRVLVSIEGEGWSCAWFSGRHAESVGWLPTDELTPVAPHAPAARDWVGRWEPMVGGGDRIDIAPARSGPSLHVRGRANWVGGINGFGERVVHVGAFVGDGSPVGDLLTIDDDGCTVRLQWVSGQLVVADNASCGGMNVRFDDVYRMRRR